MLLYVSDDDVTRVPDVAHAANIERRIAASNACFVFIGMPFFVDCNSDFCDNYPLSP